MLRRPIHKLILSSACILLLVAPVSDVQAKSDASHKKGARSQSFELRVLFGLPWLERTEIKTVAGTGDTFIGQTLDKKGHAYYIGGMLLARRKGKYPLILTCVTWDLGKEVVHTMKPELELNKPIAFCSSDGIIHNCVAVTLSPIRE
jgi:hypothetical protein